MTNENCPECGPQGGTGYIELAFDRVPCSLCGPKDPSAGIERVVGIDIALRDDATIATPVDIIEHKTANPWGNSYKHDQQASLLRDRWFAAFPEMRRYEHVISAARARSFEHLLSREEVRGAMRSGIELHKALDRDLAAMREETKAARQSVINKRDGTATSAEVDFRDENDDQVYEPGRGLATVEVTLGGVGGRESRIPLGQLRDKLKAACDAVLDEHLGPAPNCKHVRLDAVVATSVKAAKMFAETHGLKNAVCTSNDPAGLHRLRGPQFTNGYLVGEGVTLTSTPRGGKTLAALKACDFEVPEHRLPPEVRAVRESMRGAMSSVEVRERLSKRLHDHVRESAIVMLADRARAYADSCGRVHWWGGSSDTLPVVGTPEQYVEYLHTLDDNALQSVIEGSVTL